MSVCNCEYVNVCSYGCVVMWRGVDLQGSGSTLRSVDTKEAGKSPALSGVSPLHQFSSLEGRRRGEGGRQKEETVFNMNYTVCT